MLRITIGYVDTCASDYLQDHHTRENELLLGVSLSTGDTVSTVLKGLEQEWRQCDGIPYIDADFDGLNQDAAFRDAMIVLRATSNLTGPWSRYEIGDDVYAYFVLTLES